MYISIDCDNVLCDTARAFIRYYEEEYGDVVEYDTITHAYLQDNAQFAKFPHDGTYGAYMDFFEHATRAGYLLPIAGSQDAVQALLDAGHRLCVVTGRVDIQREATQARLDMYFPGCFQQLYMTNDVSEDAMTKGELCTQLGVDVHVDDFSHYIGSIVDAGIPSILLDAPRNIPYDEVAEGKGLVTRCRGRSEVLRSLTIQQFQKKILSRYDEHGREFPWRSVSPDPYHVLVSEVMSQQTQVDRVVPKFLTFMKVLPTIYDLSECKRSVLLGLRSGLGFNSRAIRLQEAAKVICGEYDGIVPRNRDVLLSLPGIGPYTSASICAFAYNLPEPVVDTNIRRVLIYELGSALGIDISTSPKRLEEIARQCVPIGQSSRRHSALMDYGALVATAKATGIRPVSKQSAFVGSDRQVRGWILKQLVAGVRLTLDLVGAQFPKKEVKSIVRGMEREGLVKVDTLDELDKLDTGDGLSEVVISIRE